MKTFLDNLRDSRGNIRRAADLSGISSVTIYNRLRDDRFALFRANVTNIRMQFEKAPPRLKQK